MLLSDAAGKLAQPFQNYRPCVEQLWVSSFPSEVFGLVTKLGSYVSRQDWTRVFAKGPTKLSVLCLVLIGVSAAMGRFWPLQPHGTVCYWQGTVLMTWLRDSLSESCVSKGGSLEANGAALM